MFHGYIYFSWRREVFNGKIEAFWAYKIGLSVEDNFEVNFKKGNGKDILEFIGEWKKFLIYEFWISVFWHEPIGGFSGNSFELPRKRFISFFYDILILGERVKVLSDVRLEDLNKELYPGVEIWALS